MNDSQKKISELPSKTIVAENDLIAVAGSDGTDKVKLGDLRTSINYDNAFNSLQEGIAGTAVGGTFHVYVDDSKMLVNEYIRVGAGASPVIDVNGDPVILTTGNYQSSLSTEISSMYLPFVSSFDKLRDIKPAYEGCKIQLRSYNEGKGKGGGTFIGHLVARGDNRATIANRAGAAFHWERENAIPLTPEMAGAFGDGTVDDTIALRAIINLAAASYSKVVRGDGSYLVSSPLQVNSYPGLQIELFEVKVDGDNWPKADYWLDTRAFIEPNPAAGSQSGHTIHVQRFDGAKVANWINNKYNGFSTTDFYCGYMSNHVIGYHCFNTKYPTTMNHVRGGTWSGGLVGVRIKTGSANPTEAHTVDVKFLASNRWGGTLLYNGSQYSRILGTQDYNGQYATVLTVSSYDGIDYGNIITNQNGDTAEVLGRYYYRGGYRLYVGESARTTNNSSKFAIGDTIKFGDAYTATVSDVLTPNNTATGRWKHGYFDILCDIHSGGFARCQIECEYLGGLIGAFLFTNYTKFGHSANLDNNSLNGLGVTANQNEVMLYARQFDDNPRFKITETDVQVTFGNLRLFNGASLLGYDREINVPTGIDTWIISLPQNSSPLASFWKIYVSTTYGSGAWCEYGVLVRGSTAQIVNFQGTLFTASMDGLKIMLKQGAQANMQVRLNAIRVN